MSKKKEIGASLKVLHEDNHIIVVIKPVNIPTQADSSGDHDLASEIKTYLKNKYDKPGNVFLGMVHRLDRPVGGVMVFAKTSKAASRLSDQFRRGVVKKEYAATVEGLVEDDHKTLVHYLIKDKDKNRTRAFVNKRDDAKKATLTYETIETDGKTTLLSVTPHTGRPHQIRVQLSAIGHPIVGDIKYKASEPLADKSIMLWATRLKFTHPVTKEFLTFKALTRVSRAER